MISSTNLKYWKVIIYFNQQLTIWIFQIQLNNYSIVINLMEVDDGGG